MMYSMVLKYDKVPYTSGLWPNHRFHFQVVSDIVFQTSYRMMYKGLNCRLRYGSVIPYAVYKEEIYSFQPYISLIHDIITDREAEMVKHLAFPQVDIELLMDIYNVYKLLY